MKRKRSRLRKRYGRSDARKMWRVLYKGGDYGFIAAHDYDEARAIAEDAAPPSWNKNEIDVVTGH